MSLPEFIDKVSTPIGAGVGALIGGTILSKYYPQPKWFPATVGVSVALFFGALKYFGLD